MSIDPASIYDTLRVDIPGFNTSWTIYGPLPGDLVAGLVAGLYIIVGEAEVKFFEFDYDFEVIVEITKGRDTPIVVHNNTVDDALEHYIIQFNDDPWTLTPRPQEGHFGWFLRYSTVIDNHVLYTFQSPEFVQGFISIFNGVGIDFRQYVLGTPYKFEGGVRVHYRILGHQITIPGFGLEEELDEEIAEEIEEQEY